MKEKSFIAKFLEENPGITKTPYKLFGAYNLWLRREYAESISEEEKDSLQAEADRLSDIYNYAIEELVQ